MDISSSDNHKQKAELARIIRSLFYVAIGLIVVWLGAFVVYRAFPFIRPFEDVVIDFKADYLSNEVEFGDDVDYRVVIFGTSIVLNGFIPEEFDALDPDRIKSYNGGMPGSVEFVPQLESMVANGEIPTHVFITQSINDAILGAEATQSIDQRLMDRLFPFNDLFIDLGTFLVTARTRGGVTEHYNWLSSTLDEIREGDGYHFRPQGGFPNETLPEDASRPTDTLDEPASPVIVDVDGDGFQRLVTLSERYHITFVFVPRPLRDSAVAPAPLDNPELEQAIELHPNFINIGQIIICIPIGYLVIGFIFAQKVRCSIRRICAIYSSKKSMHEATKCYPKEQIQLNSIERNTIDTHFAQIAGFNRPISKRKVA